ncbi:MAG: ATP-binding protein [Planctomycetia bacterium]|nr:ATP-binding protein [Planctomycetia bacterium]
MPTPRPSSQPAVRPFMTLPRVASFHASRDAQAALDGLHRAIVRAEGIGLVIGSTGTGKSLLLTCLRDKLEGRFAVALLAGARICTRRGLWQSILADIGEPYAGLDEEEVRIGLVDRIRGLAATGGGLVVLVDEAQSPRLINQVCDQALRLAEQQGIDQVGTAELAAAWEEIQRLPPPPAIQAALEPPASRVMEPPAEEQPPGITESVTAAGEEAGLGAVEDACHRETADDGAASIEFGTLDDIDDGLVGHAAGAEDLDCQDEAAYQFETVSFPQAKSASDAAGHDSEEWQTVDCRSRCSEQLDAVEQGEQAIGFAASLEATEYAARALLAAAGGVIDCGGDDEVMMRVQTRPLADRLNQQTDDIELIFDPPFAVEDGVSRPDPFAEIFADEEMVVERFVMNGPDDFENRLHVASREGQMMARQLPACELAAATTPDEPNEIAEAEFVPGEDAVAEERGEPEPEIESDPDDSDMVVIEEDLYVDPHAPEPAVQAVRLGDYSRLFARLRRGGQLESSRQA